MAEGTGHDEGQGSSAALVLTDGGDRRWDSAPAGVEIGIVRLAGWQVHQLRAPASFAGQDSYLIKVNYELALEPEAPALRWFEVGLSLSAAGAAGEVAVLDALPRSVFQPCGPASYGVGGQLSFTPGAGSAAAEVDLPALSPFIDAFGLGGPQVRWRYLADGPGGVRPGSYVSWIIVAVPAGAGGLDVQLTARYDVDPDEALGYLPETRPGAFSLTLAQPDGDARRLPAGPGPGSALASAATASAPPSASAPPARVFISYAHDDEPHKESVRALAELLLRCGLDVHMDRWDLDQRRDWYQWASGQVLQADFVVVVASPQCRLAGDWKVENTRNRGLQSEMALLRELLHSDRAGWRPRLLPVVLPGGSVSDIPLFLQPQTADHYLVEELSERGAEDLLRALTRQPAYQRPEPGKPLILPPRPPAL
jgi:hypothetical protein